MACPGKSRRLVGGVKSGRDIPLGLVLPALVRCARPDADLLQIDYEMLPAVVAQGIARFADVAKAVKDNGLRLRGSISCSFGCPYQGDVPLDAVADVVGRMRDLGCDEIDIADTIGVATPRKTQAVLARAIREFHVDRLAGHFHDTYGQALANIYASLELGISIFHSSVAGLGGCPYAKGATGNIATEDVLYMMNGLGIETGVDLDAVAEAGHYISQFLGRKSSSRAGNALLARRNG